MSAPAPHGEDKKEGSITSHTPLTPEGVGGMGAAGGLVNPPGGLVNPPGGLVNPPGGLIKLERIFVLKIYCSEHILFWQYTPKVPIPEIGLLGRFGNLRVH